MNAIPAHVQAMMNAYVAETGIQVRLNWARQSALSAIAALPHGENEPPFGADDVRAVLAHLKTLLRQGKGGVTDASLDFRNCLLNVDTFEERARKLRQRKQRNRGASASNAIETRLRLPDGSQVLAVQPPAQQAPAEVSKQVAEGLRKFRAQMGSQE
jgi:hypothetical protein